MHFQRFSAALVLASVAAVGSPAKNPAYSVKSTASGQASGTANKVPIYYDFKGARLGMPIHEWRAQRPLTRRVEGFEADQPICSGDSIAKTQKLLEFGLSPVEAAAQVTVCGYYARTTVGRMEFWGSVSIPIGELSANNVYYKFLDGKLYQIEFTGDSELLSNVVDGLTAKWGPPDTVINDTTQNKAGATFPHTVKIWRNPAATIRIESPFTRIDNLNVSYETTDGLARIKAVEKAINPDRDKM